jgi:hypothetical protein
MTIAPWVGVMATVFKIRWVLTVYLLELAVRVMLLGAFLVRSGGRREPARKIGA